jgi:hypothetical protein
MNRTKLLALLMPLALAPALSAQAPFEGTATFKTTMEGKTFESKYYSNGKRFRSDMSMGGQEAITITDFAEGKSYTLIPAQKKYLVMDYQAMAAALKPMADKLGGDKPGKPDHPDLSTMPKITATGHKETIAGYSCEHYTMQLDPKSAMDFCVAKGLGYFSMAGGAGGMGGGGMAQVLAASNPAYKEMLGMFKDGFFLLKFSMSQNGKTMMESEATQIHQGSVPAEMLAIPSDYTELKMPGLGNPLKRP